VLGDTNTHDARLHYQQALDLTRVLGDQDLIAGLLRNVGRVLSDQGEYESASSLLREAEAICIRLQDALGLARTLAHSSHVSRESEQQADADAAAQRLLALLGALDDFELRIWTYLELGRNALARGDLPAAGTWLGRGLELADDLAEREWVAYATLERAAVRFRQGEIGTALADLTLAFHTLRDTGSDFGTVLCLEHFASIAAVSGQADRALLLWGSIDAWRTRTGYVVPAFDRRRRAAERAAAEGLVQRGPAPLLAAVPALDLEHACRIALHVTAAHIQPATLRLTGAPPTAPSPSPLSRRETQVLALVAESLSNQEIAERMFISASTAMKHVEHIFEKLGVNRRMEAVRVGRQSGWLPHEP